MGRPKKRRFICAYPVVEELTPKLSSDAPQSVKDNADKQIHLYCDEYETLRLIDYEGYEQSQCAEKMCVSRTTVTRLYESARRKVSEAIVCGKKLVLETGDNAAIDTCKEPKSECARIIRCPLRRL